MAASGIMARIGVAHLTWKRHLQEGMVHLGITLKQFYVLRQLERREFLYPSQLADALFADRSTASVILGNMEREGWVDRAPDPEDGRRVRVRLARRGRAKLQEVRESPEMQRRWAFDPIAPLDEAEQAELDRLLRKLNEHLETLRDEGKNGS